MFPQKAPKTISLSNKYIEAEVEGQKAAAPKSLFHLEISPF